MIALVIDPIMCGWMGTSDNLWSALLTKQNNNIPVEDYLYKIATHTTDSSTPLRVDTSNRRCMLKSSAPSKVFSC